MLGLTLTGRWPFPASGEIVFMRFGDNHHDIVLMPGLAPLVDAIHNKRTNE